MTAAAAAAAAGVAVFGPGPRLTVSIERDAEGRLEPHLHPGGQGVWVARMIGVMGVSAHLCVPLGGETGSVVAHLLDDEGIAHLREVPIRGDTTLHVEQDDGGSRSELSFSPEPVLDRHELDDLSDLMLGAAMAAGVAVLTGTVDPDRVDADRYTRLVTDLRATGVQVVIDLSGPQLLGALEGMPHVVKVSDRELHEAGLASGRTERTMLGGLDRLEQRGVEVAIITRGEDPSLVLVAGERLRIEPPHLSTVNHRGAGDSLTGALAAGLARGLEPLDALRLGAAAGAVNVTRHGLATGLRATIEELEAQVVVRPLDRIGGT